MLPFNRFIHSRLILARTELLKKNCVLCCFLEVWSNTFWKKGTIASGEDLTKITDFLISTLQVCFSTCKTASYVHELLDVRNENEVSFLRGLTQFGSNFGNQIILQPCIYLKVIPYWGTVDTGCYCNLASQTYLVFLRTQLSFACSLESSFCSWSVTSIFRRNLTCSTFCFEFLCSEFRKVLGITLHFSFCICSLRVYRSVLSFVTYFMRTKSIRDHWGNRYSAFLSITARFCKSAPLPFRFCIY